jgi:hypothetical protein
MFGAQRPAEILQRRDVAQFAIDDIEPAEPAAFIATGPERGVFAPKPVGVALRNPRGARCVDLGSQRRR